MTPFEHQTGRLATDDGLELFYQSWIPPKVERILLFIHGLGEHSGRYTNPVLHFAPRAAACWSVDLRGHGHSPGRRVHVDHFDDYTSDVAVLHRTAQEHHPELPIFLVGHSMGGLIALRYLLDGRQHVAGGIISSPGLAAHPDFEPPAFLKSLARLLSRIAPRLLIPSNLDSSAISRDPEVVAAYRADPLVSNKVSARWYTSMVDAQAEVFERAATLDRPILLMQSAADRLVSPQATHRWATAAPEQWVQYQVWEGFFHEMFNEPERAQVFELMEHWLATQAASGSSQR